MLERGGIVRVVPGSSVSRFRLQLLQPEIAEDALKFLTVRETTAGGSAGAAALRAQRYYIHVERDRAKLALTAQVDEVEQARLVAALRDETVRRTIGGR